MDMKKLERLLDEQLQRGHNHRRRYMVHPQGEGWAVVDCEQDQAHGGRSVRTYEYRHMAQSAALFGNVLGPCEHEKCAQPATVLVYGVGLCIDHVPATEPWGLIPLEVLRLWRQGECGAQLQEESS